MVKHKTPNLVIQTRLEVGQRGLATSAIRHNLKPSVNKPFLEKLGKNPPHRFHELGIHGLVIVLEIDPAPSAGDDLLPFSNIASDYATALLIIGGNTHCKDIIPRSDGKLGINFKLNRKAMAIPSEAAGDMPATHGLISSDDILDGTCEDVAIVRLSRGEGRAIIEDILRLGLRALELILKSPDIGPQAQDALLLVGKREVLALAYLFHGGSERRRRG